MSEPVFTELNSETVRIYADYLAHIFGTTAMHDETSEITEDFGQIAFDVPLFDGTSATIWLESGRVYGEA